MLHSSGVPDQKLTPFRGTQGFQKNPSPIDWQALSGAFTTYNPVELVDWISPPQIENGNAERSRAKSDNAAQGGDTIKMSEITREEFNARMETIEVKMDARVESVSVKIDAFLSAQAERDKAQLERDKRYELLADRITNAAESAADAARQAATVKSNYWAAVGVQLLAVGAILVGAYFANQGNTLMVAQTTLSAFTSGRDSIQPSEKKPSPQLQQPQPNKQPE